MSIDIETFRSRSSIALRRVSLIYPSTGSVKVKSFTVVQKPQTNELDFTWESVTYLENAQYILNFNSSDSRYES